MPFQFYISQICTVSNACRNIIIHTANVDEAHIKFHYDKHGVLFQNVPSFSHCVKKELGN